MSPDPIISLLYTTFPDLSTAEQIAERLIAEHLAACVHLLPGLISFYSWRGMIEKNQEIGCLIKTSPAKVAAVRQSLIEMHSYECPCILEWSSDHVHPPYAQWLMGWLD